MSVGMKQLSLRLIVDVLQGELQRDAGQGIVANVVASPQKLTPGALLFDLPRRRQLRTRPDLPRTAFAVVTDRPLYWAGLEGDFTIIRVPEIREAYWRFVDYYRNLFSIPVIGVTGTCGKTTTKEMIRHILAGSGRVIATYKSNNALSRNLGYLLEIDEETQAAVFEMGVAFPGDLEISCRYFKPQVGVVTNIGVDHLSGFGTLEAYIKAKAKIVEGLNYRGKLILNADDENSRRIDLSRFQGEVVTFGAGDQAHFRIADLRHQTRGISFRLEHQGRCYRLSIPGHGEFNALNAAAAIAAVHSLDFPVAEAVERLQSFQNVEKHFEFKPGINGSVIIDDTWSTNPTSVEAAAKLLKNLAHGRKTIAVLGKMALLGKESDNYHRKTGEKVGALGIDWLVVVGEGAEEIGRGAIASGMSEDRVYFCRDLVQTCQVLKKLLDNQTIALVKTSMLASFGDLIAKITRLSENEGE
ncbi:MAG TPA: UDP-N-acetylmuramoyl-tripeptide--D-alanyl-D-alanine ligase [Bacillota bacterium]|nr:UDP-N-acetylmuramoyl-tripeptide--D-alanyl-D-alanine ligase [Bacillota bacterium]